MTNIEIFIRHLRTGYEGLLRMNPAFADYGLKDLLPLRLKDPDEGCTRVNRTQYCFDAGICLIIITIYLNFILYLYR